jgi:hypothetical protein
MRAAAFAPLIRVERGRSSSLLPFTCLVRPPAAAFRVLTMNPGRGVAELRQWAVVGLCCWMSAASAAEGGQQRAPAVCLLLTIETANGLVDIWTVKKEVTRIWRANGVEVVYPERGSHSCLEATDETVRLVLVDHPSDLPKRLVARVSLRALGATIQLGGVPTNLVLAFAERAVTAAGKVTGCVSRESSCVSLLLARVIAHELGHVLLRSGAHGRTGLMRATFAQDDLGTSPIERYLLADNERDRVLARLGKRDGEHVATRSSPRFSVGTETHGACRRTRGG